MMLCKCAAHVWHDTEESDSIVYLLQCWKPLETLIVTIRLDWATSESRPIVWGCITQILRVLGIGCSFCSISLQSSLKCMKQCLASAL